MSIVRKIIEIDEQACNGCGMCVLDCAENALAIIDGKARVISDKLCDGLGSCLQSCPQNALHIVERQADPFDVEAVEALQVRLKHYFDQQNEDEVAHEDDAQHSADNEHKEEAAHAGIQGSPLQAHSADPIQGGCQLPGSDAKWPIKLRLVPATAPFLKKSRILLTADCVPAVLKDFAQMRDGHENNCVILACPKFESPRALAQKLLEIVEENSLEKLEVLRMEVPCCKVLADVALRVALDFAQTAQQAPPPLHIHIVSRKGDIL